MYFKITSVYNNYPSAADGDTNKSFNNNQCSVPKSAPAFGDHNDSSSWSSSAGTSPALEVVNKGRRERTISREEMHALVLTKMIVSRFNDDVDDESSRDGEEWTVFNVFNTLT